MYETGYLATADRITDARRPALYRKWVLAHITVHDRCAWTYVRTTDCSKPQVFMSTDVAHILL